MGMATRPDPIRIVEAAYASEPDEQCWLDGIVRAASPYDIGGGVVAYTIGIAERTQLGSVSKTERAGDEFVSMLAGVIESFPPDIAGKVFAPTEFVGNSAFRLSRISREHRSHTVAAVRRALELLPPLWVLLCGDPRFRSLALCFSREGTRKVDAPFPHRDARSIGMVGAHLAAALRLRTLVYPPADNTSGAGETEAVLTPGGDVLRATGAASSVGARASLAAAVRASETARGRMRRSSPDEAIGLWRALVQGRWTVLDSTDGGGKRILLARKNPLHGGNLLDLTADERDVAWLAAQGHSYKYIGYELGVPLSTVAGRLRRAMHKLRIRTRTELLRKLGAPEREQ